MQTQQLSRHQPSKPLSALMTARIIVHHQGLPAHMATAFVISLRESAYQTGWLFMVPQLTPYVKNVISNDHMAMGI